MRLRTWEVKSASLGLNSYSSVAGSVTLAKLLNLLLPQFPHLSHGDNSSISSVAGRVGGVEVTRVKHLAQHLVYGGPSTQLLVLFISLALAVFENFLKYSHTVGDLGVSPITL